MTNQELNLKLKDLAAKERELTQLILKYIAEVDRRKLFLEMAYPNLYEYLTKEIGYSEGAAQRRIDAARLIQKLPEVSEKIRRGSITLAQIAKVQKICRQIGKSGPKVGVERQRELIAKIENCGSAQTELILRQEFRLPDLTKIEMSFTQEELQILKQAQAILSNKTGGGLKETVLEMARQVVKLAAPKSTATVAVKPISAKFAINKTVTPKEKAEIRARDQVCQFKIGDKICGSKHFLEIDHIQPRWSGGSNARNNLRVLCRNHNQFRYKSGDSHFAVSI